MAKSRLIGIGVVANTNNFKAGLSKSVQYLNDFAKNVTAVQQKINSQFKFSGLDNNQTAQIQKQFEYRARLDDEMFAATHTAREVELRNLTSYYDNMRSMFSQNESMLTSITETENARRLQIENSYQIKSLKQLHMAYVKRTAIVAGALMTLTRIFEATTESHKKLEQSGGAMSDYVIVIADSIPIFNRFTESMANMILQIGGLNKALSDRKKMDADIENMKKKFFELNKSYREMKDGFTYDIKNIGITDQQQKINQVMKQYKDELMAISELRYDGLSQDKSINLINQAAEKTTKLIQAIRAEPAESIFKQLGDELAKIKTDLDTFGMSDVDKTVFNLSQLGSGLEGNDLIKFTEQIDKIKESLIALDKETKLEEFAEKAKKAFEQMEESANSLKDSLKTPVERFKDFRDELDKMKAANLLTQKQYDILLANKGKGLFDMQAPKALGSQSSFGTYNAKYMDISAFEGQGKDDRLIQKQDQIINKHSEAIGVLQKLETWLRNIATNTSEATE